MGLLFAALPPNYHSVLGKLCYLCVLQLPLYETMLTFSVFLCRTHGYLQTGRQNQGRTLALMVTQDLLLLLLHLHWWKNSQPLLWGFPVTGTGRISASQTTGLNVSSESTVYKTIANLSNSTKKPTVRALKVKEMSLRQVAQSNHSLGTVLTPKQSTNGLRVSSTLSCLCFASQELSSLPAFHSAFVLFCNSCCLSGWLHVTCVCVYTQTSCDPSFCVTVRHKGIEACKESLHWALSPSSQF